MVLTVGKSGSAGSRVVPKRTSLKDRARISEINKKRKEEGKKELEGTKQITVPEPQQTPEAKELRAAQATIRELNASAELSGSNVQYSLVERDGKLQIQKTEVQRRNASNAAGVGGAQQVPALQSQISRQQTTTKTEYTPVGSFREGGVILKEESSGKTFGEVGSSVEGGVILTETVPGQYIDSTKPVFSNRRSAGFVTPTGFLSEQRRKDITDFGKFLEEGGKKTFEISEKAPPGVNVAALTTSFGQRTLGGALQRLGSDPQRFTAEEIVAPSAGGALFGASTRVAVRGTEAGVLSAGGSRLLARGSAAVLETGLSATGVAAIGSTIVSRMPEEQSTDVVFAGLGAKAGSRPITGLDTPIKDPVFYGGVKTPNRASRLNLKTANKPTSKTEIRKQSFNQAYNPNVYRNGGEFGVKEGKSREFVRFTGSGSAEVGQRRPASEFGVKGQSVEAGFKIQKGQAPQEFQRFTFTQSGSKPKDLPGVNKAVKFSGRKDFELGYQDTVVAIQKNKGYQALQAFEGGKRTPIKPQERFIDQSQFFAETKNVPQYEFKPNAPSGFDTSTQRVSIAGSQPGRGRVYENILSKAYAKNAARTDFVLVEPIASPVSSVPAPPVKDIALSGRFQGIPSVASSRGVTSLSSAGSTVTGLRPVGVTIDVQPTSSVSRPIQSVKPFTATVVPEKERTALGVSPQLKIVNTEKQLPTPKIFTAGKTETYTVIKPDVKQVPVAAQRNVVQQRNEQRSEQVTATGFSFTGAPTPNLKFTFPEPKTIDKPSITERPGINKPKDIYRPYREVPGVPSTPPRFAFPDKARSAAQYEVQVGSKGNKYFFDLGRGGSEVLTKARDLAKGTAAASIRVKPVGRGGEDVGRLLGSDFVRNKTGVYVQKTETRISSSGEKAQIPGASKNKRLTKGTAYGDALSKIKRGASLRGLRRGFF